MFWGSVCLVESVWQKWYKQVRGNWLWVRLWLKGNSRWLQQHPEKYNVLFTQNNTTQPGTTNTNCQGERQKTERGLWNSHLISKHEMKYNRTKTKKQIRPPESCKQVPSRHVNECRQTQVRHLMLKNKSGNWPFAKPNPPLVTVAMPFKNFPFLHGTYSVYKDNGGGFTTWNSLKQRVLDFKQRRTRAGFLFLARNDNCGWKMSSTVASLLIKLILSAWAD